tara:strand:+ start:4401 stop:5366 length:966 start_codon:yes stop_codon:yes gene_type:complete
LILFYATSGVFAQNVADQDLLPSGVYETAITVPVNDGNYVRARKSALQMAMEDAIRQALDRLFGESNEKLNTLTRQEIVANAKQYVKNYRFIYARDNLENQSEDIRLNISLYIDALKKNLRSLGVLGEPEGQGAVVIIIRETSISSERNTSFWDYIPISETALTQKFATAGIPIIGRSTLSNLVTEKTALLAIQGDLGAALEIGAKTGVDTVIVGNAATTRLESTGKGESVQANISVKTISVQKGIVIAAKSDFAYGHGENALEGELMAFETASIRLSNFLLQSLKRMGEVVLLTPGKTKDQTAESTQLPSPPSSMPFPDL